MWRRGGVGKVSVAAAPGPGRWDLRVGLRVVMVGLRAAISKDESLGGSMLVAWS